MYNWKGLGKNHHIPRDKTAIGRLKTPILAYCTNDYAQNITLVSTRSYEVNGVARLWSGPQAQPPFVDKHVLSHYVWLQLLHSRVVYKVIFSDFSCHQ